jgi:hypothetical protein
MEPFIESGVDLGIFVFQSNGDSSSIIGGGSGAVFTERGGRKEEITVKRKELGPLPTIELIMSKMRA